MEKMIAVVFDNEPKAREGFEALRELDSEGEICVYDAQVVARDPSGAVRVIDNGDTSGFPLAPGGAVVGALVGLLGGPVGALVVGATGALIGSIADVQEGLAEDFVNDVTTALTPGKVALIADLTEEWAVPVDMRMECIGGVVFRRTRDFVKTTLQDRDAAAYQAEMEQLNAERAQARSDRLAKIDAKFDNLRLKLENALEHERIKMQLRQQEREAKIQVLEKRAEQAQGELRRRQEARIAELRREYAEKAAMD